MTKKLVSGKSFMKYIMVFVFGIFFTFAITNGYTVIKSTVQNAVQFIKETVFTDSGLDTGTRLMDINGSAGYIWINTGLLNNGTGWNTKFLALDESGMVIYAPEGDPIFSGSAAGTITFGNINNWNGTYNRINNSGSVLWNRYITTGNYATNWVMNNITGALTNYYTTSFSFDSGTNLLTLNVSGYGPVTGYVVFSGMSNWNTAYNRVNNTGINVNTLATTSLSCLPGELVKYNGSAWECSGDLVGGGGGASLWTGPIPLLTPIQAGEVKFQVGDTAQTIGTDTIALGRSTIAGGDYSVAIGNGPHALGDNSVAMGVATIADGTNSTALGNTTHAVGNDSTAMGVGTHASGQYSTAMGRHTNANGTYSTAMGNVTQANGDNSTAMGSSTEAKGFTSTAMGRHTLANGYASTAMGNQTVANSTGSLAIGSFNIGYSTSVFEIGIGTNSSTDSGNAMIVRNSGDITFPKLPNYPCIGTDASGTLISVACGGTGTGTGYWFAVTSGIAYIGGDIITNGFISRGTGVVASGAYSTAMGRDTTAKGDNSIAMGELTTASGQYSVAMGLASSANGYSSVAMGIGTVASGDYSFVMGTYSYANGYSSIAMGENLHANGQYSVAMGSNNFAGGDYSMAIGQDTDANGDSSTAMGKFNKGYSHSLFEIGRGTNLTRANAMTVRDSGDISFPMLPNYPCIGTDASGTLISVSCGSGSGSGSGDSLWAPNGSGDIYNKNLTGKVSVGLTNPTVDFQVSGNVIFGHPSNNGINNGAYSFIFGDKNNIAGGNQSHVGGYGGMIRNSNFSTIAGGEGNKIQTRDHSFIGGGSKNLIDCWNYYTVGSKDELIPVFDGLCIIGGGTENIISGASSLSFIGAGLQNNIKSASFASNIVGGANNTISGIGDGTGYLSSIVGGYTNTISGTAKLGFIGGGQLGLIDESINSFIGGGKSNTIQTSNFGFIGGGGSNNILRTIIGREGNNIYNTIVGGNSNIIDSTAYSFIGGGKSNNITSTVSLEIIGANTIGGGRDNVISGTAAQYNFIGGGSSNSITGQSLFSTIPGGRGNSIIGVYNSFAAGRNAQALHNYSFVWNDSTTQFSTMKDNTFIIHSSAGVGINTADIATGVDIEINQVMRLKPQSGVGTGAQPFACDVDHEGSVFMYHDIDMNQSYLCYCGLGMDVDGLHWRRIADDFRNGYCGFPKG